MKSKSPCIVKPLLLIFIVFVTVNLFSSCMTMSMNHDLNASMKTPGLDIVKIKYNNFSPESITVPVNTIVTWVNRDWWSHTVKSDSILFDSGKIKRGKVFNYKFTVKGTYKYHCDIHEKMTAKVIVE